ncbi:DNA-directed RNA polymerase III subunit RPC5 [Trichuris trichiura]|uniref:DNA-directed RNA polymerase III subunit RPC5 n=1 Tax=Trichuris trichiura TaxID=36087 RepID=A0A077Z0F8_TRITR|nr:DNA-directed RNA polymerase III subunit RPC5 [Trichuris trichiura]
MRNNDNDPIVRTIPVRFHVDYQKSLHVLQFPLASLGRREIPPSRATLYAKHHKLELHFPMVARYSELEEEPFEIRREQCLTGIPFGGVNRLCYSVGYFKRKTLHVTNLGNIIMMRPKPSPFEAKKQNQSQEGASSLLLSDAARESAVGGAKTASSASKVEFVRVRFARLKRKTAKVRTIFDTDSSSDDELYPMEKKWNLKIDYTNGKHLSTCLCNSGRQNKRSPAEYAAVASRCHIARSIGKSMHGKFKEKVFQAEKHILNLLKASMRSSALFEEQMLNILRVDKILRFEEIRSFIPQYIDDFVVLKALEEVGVLVRGLWVKKSEYVFTGDDKTWQGWSTTRAQLINARDFILYGYMKKPILSLREVDSSYMPLDVWRSLFVSISTMVRNKGWKLMTEPDDTFAQRFPTIASRQQRIWDSRTPHFAKCFSNVTEEGRILKAGDQVSYLSSADNTDEENARRDRCEKMDQSNPTLAHSAAPIGGSPHGISSNGVISACFKAQPLLTISMLREAVNSSMKSGNVQAEMTNYDIEQCAVALGAVQLQSKEKEGGEKMFAATKFGSWPHVRLLIVEMLRDKGKFTFTVFKKACTAKFAGNMPEDAELRELVQEYCCLRRGTYYVKEV